MGLEHLIPKEYADKLGEIDNWLLTVDETETALAVAEATCTHGEETCKRCNVERLFYAQAAKIGRLIGYDADTAQAFAEHALNAQREREE